MDSTRYGRYFLMSDLDGTLFASSSQVDRSNLPSLDAFMRHGGLFGISTGRTPANTLSLLGALRPNMPSIFLNGSLVYDTVRRRVLKTEELEQHTALRIAQICLLRHPAVNVHVYDAEHTCIVSPESLADPKWTASHQPVVFTSVDVAKQAPWLKMMLIGTHAELADIQKEIMKENLLEENRAVFSSPVFLEILPKKASKGSMLSYIRDALFPNRTCCAIGDYYNDIELLQEADVSAVPANGIEELKRIATYVVSDNNHGAVADFIDKLR